MTPQTTKKSTFVSHSRWLAYTAATAATAFTGAGVAEADVFYSGKLGIDFSGNNLVHFSLGSNGSFTLIHVTGSNGNPFGSALFQIARSNTFNAAQSFAGASGGPFSSRRYVAKLASNVLISAQNFIQTFSAGSFGVGRLARHSSNPGSQWLSTGTGFIAFKFNIGRPGGPQYGWARITMTSGAPLHNFRLVDYAYASPGEALRTGQTMEVPEPGSLGLLALGGMGLLAWRQRRQIASS